jgi:hypothetical protein
MNSSVPVLEFPNHLLRHPDQARLLTYGSGCPFNFELTLIEPVTVCD